MSQRQPALDGLRGIAILLVMGHHLYTNQLPKTWNWFIAGGYLGVTLFFVLSGYLITSGLIKHPNRRAFYERRIVRLAPALLVFLMFCTTWVILEGGKLAPWIRTWIASLTLSTNWWMMFSRDFNIIPASARPLWSLAVEEQFYLVWPTILIAATAWLARRSSKDVYGRLAKNVAIAAGLAILASVLMAALLTNVIQPEFLVTRFTKFSTLTQLPAILFGALIALIQARDIPWRLPKWTVIAPIGLVYLWSHNTGDHYANSLYIAAAAVLSAVVVARVVNGQSPHLERSLTNSILRWFGRRSYALYIWNLMLVITADRLPYPVPVKVVWILTANLIIAEASWRLVEQPATRWYKKKRQHPSDDQGSISTSTPVSS